MGESGRPPTRLRDCLPAGVWQDILRLGTVVRFAGGQTLLCQGDSAEVVFALVEGRVKVTKVEADGTELLLAIRETGDVVGEVAVLDGGTRSATVTAVGNCTVYLVPAAAFRRFVAEHRLGESFARHALGRLREADELRMELVALPVAQRLARLLVRLAESCGTATVDGILLDVQLPQEELARAVGASRNAVVGELSRLRQTGIVTTSRRRIVIRDLPRMRTLTSPNAPATGDGRAVWSAS